MQEQTLSRRHRSDALIVSFGIIVAALLGYIGVITIQRVAAETAVQSAQPTWGTLQVASLNKLDLDTTSQLRHYEAKIVLKNTSDKPIEFSPGLQAFLVDSTGARTAATAKFLLPDTVIGGEIAAGATWDGILDFEVSEQAAPTVLSIQLDAASANVEAKL